MERIKSEIKNLIDEWRWHCSAEAKYRCEAYGELLDFINSLQEEPVSEDLEEAAKKAGQKYFPDEENIWARPNYEAMAAENAFKAGAQWQKEQFEKNRLEHCDSITEEQYNLECGFIDQYLKKYHRMPTFLDAIEYGMKKQEKQSQKTIELAEDHAYLAGQEKVIEKACEWIKSHGGFTIGFDGATIKDFLDYINKNEHEMVSWNK